MGTSLGSCLSMLTMSHDPRIRAGAFNHVSPYFADVVWRGVSTRHVREGFEGRIDAGRPARILDADQPVALCRPGPRTAQCLLVHARYDLTFPVDLSKS